jgi:hypothetical protein
MVTFLVGTFLLIAALAIFVYFQLTQRNKDKEQSLFPPVSPNYEGLFAEQRDMALLDQRQDRMGLMHQSMIRRAKAGDVVVLREAVENESGQGYDELMNMLIESAGTTQELFRLVSHVARDERLRVTPGLALKFLETWKNDPGRLTVAEVLHVTALSNDPLLYRQASETATEYWLAGKLPQVKAEDLLTLIEGEYWILSSAARSSGAGFVLKRSIMEFRKQLVSRNSP